MPDGTLEPGKGKPLPELAPQSIRENKNGRKGIWGGRRRGGGEGGTERDGTEVAEIGRDNS